MAFFTNFLRQLKILILANTHVCLWLKFLIFPDINHGLGKKFSFSFRHKIYKTINLRNSNMSAYTFTINNQPFNVEVGSIQGDIANVTVNQVPYTVKINKAAQAYAPIPFQRPVPTQTPKPAPYKQVPPQTVQPTSQAPAAAPVPSAESTKITAPIPGRIISVDVKVGDKVESGQLVLVIEAMKMENTITSPVDGIVKEIVVDKDAEVSTDDLLMVIE